jgi:predicted amidohydrolase
MNMVKIGLIQMWCEKGAINQNLATIAAYLAEAAARGVEIVGFPEMSLTGYADPNQYPEAVLDLAGPEVGRLLAMTRGVPVTVLVGLIEGRAEGKPYITHIAARDGRLLGYYRKVTIEGDEVPWFSPGQTVPVFKQGDLTYGIAICADISNEWVFGECARQGAQLVFELAAPGLYGEQASRNWQSGFEWWQGECQRYLSRWAWEHGLWIAVATQAGRTVDEDFPGGGYLFGPHGRRLYATADWQPGAVYLGLDLERGEVTVL